MWYQKLKKAPTVRDLIELLQTFPMDESIQIRQLRDNKYINPMWSGKFVAEQIMIQDVCLVPGWNGSRWVGIIIHPENKDLKDEDVKPYIC